jgi:hypothetical protein
MPTVTEILDGHVVLEVECIDRLYLNGYVPKLQLPGDLVAFLVKHRNHPIPSPALLGKMTGTFVDSVKRYAHEHNIPIVQFEKGQRKDDIAAQHRAKFTQEEGVVFIGVAQEKSTAFKAVKKPQQGWVGFDYSRQSVFVNHYYFYIQDKEFGPGFIKICTYVPFAIRICLNGHEWVKRQSEKEGIAYESLDNGFLSCASPKRLQEICDQLGPEHVVGFFDKWVELLPFPLSVEDRLSGYTHRLSVWQVETSLTQVFDRPVRGRQFFEEVIRENIDLGRPDRVQLIFERTITKRTPTKFRTRVITHGVHPSIHIEFKKSHVKQYFKEGRALRTETTINDPSDFGVKKHISNLSYLQKLGRHINRRLLDVQRVSHKCDLSAESIERIVQPTEHDGQRVAGLKFGDPRVMGLFLALCLFVHLLDGFTNRTLRVQVAALLGIGADHYSTGQMTYDLRRLRLKGIISRVPSSNRYLLTPFGRRVVIFFTRLNARVFNSAFVMFQNSPHADMSPPLCKALDGVDREIDSLIGQAQLLKAA